MCTNLIMILCATIALISASPARAQTGEGAASPAPATASKVLGTVVEGNTTIVFESARMSDIETNQLKMWSAFAGENPKIARDLASKPALLSDGGYLKQHPVLDKFLSDHPAIRDAMTENPGNFVVKQGGQ